jgi:hypothetical protein
MRAEDVISGKMGKCYATINGNVEEMLYVKNIEASVEKNKGEVPVLGRTGMQHKAGGWNGTGSMTIYYTTSIFRKMMIEYVKTGKDTYFDLIIENEDPTSSIGKQIIVLKGVNLDSVIVSKLDVESEQLDEEISFTFQDVDMDEEFKRI